MEILYFLISFIATSIGSFVGLGGGVIIKPSLDIMSNYQLGTINTLSSISVLSMAIIAIYYQTKQDFKINLSLFLLAVGATVGGVLGTKILSVFQTIINNDLFAKGIQSLMIALLLGFVIVLKLFSIKSYKVKDMIIVPVVGVLLGALSSFLGIGGGPINVAVLCLLFSMDVKNAAISSIFIILFSQATKISTIALTTGFSSYNLHMLPFLIPGGILGGFIGSKLNKKLNVKVMNYTFMYTIGLIVLLNIYNSFVFFGILS